MIDGVRYSIPGDYAQVDADGTIHLLGRGSVCINSGGEKIFPEEVEEALKTHDAVRDAVVVGIPHPTYGEQIVAVVEPARRRRRARRGRADRPREGAAGPLQGPPAGAVRRRRSGGPPTARSTTSATGPSRWRRSGRRLTRPERRPAPHWTMFIAPVDATRGEDEWRPFVEAHRFGHLVAPGGPERDCPSSCPPNSCSTDDTVWLHLVRANPVFDALAENPRVLLSVADDWAFIPSTWKAIGDEDPALGIPTTYYGAVQLVGTATVHDERTTPGTVAAVLRRQLAAFQPDVAVADPEVTHPEKLRAILGIRSDSNRCRPSSSTAATSTRPTGSPWWSGGADGAVAGDVAPRRARLRSGSLEC